MVKHLFAGNKRFVEDVFKKNKKFFDNLVLGHAPRVMWFGCIDARVVPELITFSLPGALLVKRSVANIIPPHDRGVAAALDHAINDLEVKQIVVCGHYGCGALKTLEEDCKCKKRPCKHSKTRRHLHEFVYEAREVRQVVDALIARKGLKLSKPDYYSALVEANVLLQVRDVKNYAVVKKAAKKQKHAIRVHGVVYDVRTGELLESMPVLEKHGLLARVKKAFS